MTLPSRAAIAFLMAAAALRGGPIHAQARTPAPFKDNALVVFDDDGLRIHSADGTKQLKLRAYAVIDSRNVLSDTADGSANGIQLRRSRVIFDANLAPGLAGRVMFDVGAPSGPSPIQDAYLDVGLGRGWWMRAGKQKTPMGLERYMSISSQLLPERSIASNLTGSRDPGVLFTGPLATDAVEVAVGLFNGVADGGSTQDNDPNDAKDLTYRVWWKPWRHKVNGAEQGFSIAYNGTTGVEKSPAVAGAKLPTFKTPAQLNWFNYAEASGVRANGRHSRDGVFAALHQGAFGAMAETYANHQVVTRGANTTTVQLTGWVLNAQYTLTGEPSAQEGITPKSGFDPENGHWGATQVGFRVAHVGVGDEAFPVFADSTVAARGAIELGVGVNWYLTRLTKLQLAYSQTTFDGGAKVGDRKAERYVQARWQVYF